MMMRQITTKAKDELYGFNEEIEVILLTDTLSFSFNGLRFAYYYLLQLIKGIRCNNLPKNLTYSC